MIHGLSPVKYATESFEYFLVGVGVVAVAMILFEILPPLNDAGDNVLKLVDFGKKLTG